MSSLRSWRISRLLLLAMSVIGFCTAATTAARADGCSFIDSTQCNVCQFINQGSCYFAYACNDGSSGNGCSACLQAQAPRTSRKMLSAKAGLGKRATITKQKQAVLLSQLSFKDTGIEAAIRALR